MRIIFLCGKCPHHGLLFFLVCSFNIDRIHELGQLLASSSMGIPCDLQMSCDHEYKVLTWNHGLVTLKNFWWGFQKYTTYARRMSYGWKCTCIVQTLSGKRSTESLWSFNDFHQTQYFLQFSNDLLFLSFMSFSLKFPVRKKNQHSVLFSYLCLQRHNTEIHWRNLKLCLSRPFGLLWPFNVGLNHIVFWLYVLKVESTCIKY